jgi:hypothetical protein
MRRYLGWPEGIDYAILHMHCYESGHRVKMTRLAQRNSLGGHDSSDCVEMWISGQRPYFV